MTKKIVEIGVKHQTNKQYTRQIIGQCSITGTHILMEYGSSSNRKILLVVINKFIYTSLLHFLMLGKV